MQTQNHTKSILQRGRKHSRPPVPEDYKELCNLCRAGKLFSVQEWFKTHQYNEPERLDRRQWPIGIAIEKGFHSLVEVLLQNGIPADGRALECATEFGNADIVGLLFKAGATVDMVDFGYIVSVAGPEIVRIFIKHGADVVTGYPIADGLIRLTRPFLGIYKSYIDKYPELQFQADMALRHFCEKGNLRGVCLLMWLGANPRAKVPRDADESEEVWSSPMDAAAFSGNLEVIKKLKPDRTTDDINRLLDKSTFRKKMDVVRYWISLGADINYVTEEGRSLHSHVMWTVNWALEPRDYWYGEQRFTEAKQFLRDWFSAGAKWEPHRDDKSSFRKVLYRLSCVEAYEFIKLLVENQVMSADALAELINTPKLRAHLKEQHPAIAKFVPKVQRWIRAEERRREGKSG